jgi:hypothetical protein
MEHNSTQEKVAFILQIICPTVEAKMQMASYAKVTAVGLDQVKRLIKP